MKILNLVLYSENEPAYIGMRDVLRAHAARSPNVRCVFSIYDSAITEPWILDGDILRIRGSETFIPGILNKTIEAFRITASWEYDFLIRTNISTIVDYNEFHEMFADPRFMIGGPIGVLSWIRPSDGIFDTRFNGMPFLRGWCMIFKRSVAEDMIQNAHFIDTSVIDDVSISDFLIRKRRYVPADIKRRCCMITNDYNPGFCVFRNCTPGNRMADVERMRDIAARMSVSN